MVFVALFFGMITLPIVGAISGLGVTDAEIFRKRERRVPSRFPPPPKSTPDFENFPEAFESAFNDQLPFRDLLVKSYANLTLHGLKVPPNEKLLVGKNGHYFLATHTPRNRAKKNYSLITRSIAITPKEAAKAAAHLQNLEPFLQDLDVPVILLAIPTSPLFEFHNLPFFLQKQIDPGFLETPAAQRVINLVSQEYSDRYLLFPYEKAKQANAVHPLFPIRNFHWKTSRYTKLTASAVAEKFGISPYEEPGLDEFVTQDTISDLSNLAGIQLTNKDDLVYKHGFWRSLNIRDLELSSRYQSCPIYDESYYTVNPQKTGRLLMVGDSFARALRLDLARHFGEVVSVSFSKTRDSPNTQEWINCVFNEYKPNYIVFMHHNKFFVSRRFIKSFYRATSRTPPKRRRGGATPPTLPSNTTSRDESVD